ncbi:MAG TPA: MFS transporter, partial [Xanthobacteraceae bacterium]|nr:MFS transporter [Xanthobacteraceae bacterium]
MADGSSHLRDDSLLPRSSTWSPFRHAIFVVMWVVTVVANIGGWMYMAASGWLMT